MQEALDNAEGLEGCTNLVMKSGLLDQFRFAREMETDEADGLARDIIPSFTSEL